MAPNPQCAALAAAKDRTGDIQNSYFHQEIAHRFQQDYLTLRSLKGSRPPSSESSTVSLRDDPHYIYPEGLSNCGLVCTGAAVPTDAEFQAITVTLGIQDARV